MVFFSFSGRRSVTSDRLTSSPSRHASAAAIKVINTKTATTSSSVKGPGTMDHFSGKNISHGQNQYQQGRHYQNTIFYCCYCIHDFLKTFMISPPLNLLVRFSSFVKWNYLLCSRSTILPGRAFCVTGSSNEISCYTKKIRPLN